MKKSLTEHLLQSGITSKGYAFQLEVVHIAEQLGARIREIPITFIDRRLGKSKLSRSEVWRFFLAILRLWPGSKGFKPGLFFIIIFFGTMVLAMLPWLLNLIYRPPNTIPLGLSPYSPGDLPVYFSYILQAKSGLWLMQDLYTSEPHLGSISVVWLLLGWLARWWNLEPMTSYHLGRLFLIPVLLTSLWLAARVILPAQIRKLAWLFTIFSSGVGGWFLVLLTLTGRFPASTQTGVDLWVPEGFSFLSMLQAPHFIIANALFVLILLCWYVSTTASAGWRFALLGGVLASVLFSFHPFHLLSLIPIITAHAFILILSRQRAPKITLFHWLLWLLAALPGFLYQTSLQFFDPVLALRAAQNTTPLLSTTSFVACYAVLWLFALAGIRYLYRSHRKEAAVFLLVWCAVQTAMVFSPTQFNRRLLTGLQIGLSIAAAAGWYGLLHPMTKAISNFLSSRVQGWADAIQSSLARSKARQIGLLLVFFFTSPVLVLMVTVKSVFANPHWHYLPSAAQAAFGWIEQNVPAEEIVLADVLWANLIPGLTGRRTYAGHVVETVYWETKQSIVYSIFHSNDPMTVQQQLLTSGAQWLLTTPGDALPIGSIFKLVYDRDGFRIFKVDP